MSLKNSNDTIGKFIEYTVLNYGDLDLQEMKIKRWRQEAGDRENGRL
jgi:hypothetical protein